MDEIIKDWKANAAKKMDENFLYIRSLKMKDAEKVDRMAKKLHEEAFEKIDCLKCGNCCRVLQPNLDKNDISNIAGYLDITTNEVKEKYLELDEDGDWRINALPCPFLNEKNNKCQIYPSRPKDCREYPHTNKSGFSTRSYLHSGNTLDCPATFYIVEKMKKVIR